MRRFIITPLYGIIFAAFMSFSIAHALQIEIDTNKDSQEILAQIQTEIEFYQRRISRDKICIQTLEELQSLYNAEEKLAIDKLCTADE